MLGNMLEHVPVPPRRQWAWLGSAAIHAAVLACLLYRPAAIFVSPRFSAHGNGGSAQVVYLTSADLPASPRA